VYFGCDKARIMACGNAASLCAHQEEIAQYSADWLGFLYFLLDARQFGFDWNKTGQVHFSCDKESTIIGDLVDLWRVVINEAALCLRKP
jgi:hypothetical protein